jgi:hypothetical protein
MAHSDLESVVLAYEKEAKDFPWLIFFLDMVFPLIELVKNSVTSPCLFLPLCNALHASSR